jgi:hypothetical protein
MTKPLHVFIHFRVVHQRHYPNGVLEEVMQSGHMAQQVMSVLPPRATAKADICGATRHVRFTPEGGHVRCTSSCLLWAKTGHHVD